MENLDNYINRIIDLELKQESWFEKWIGPAGLSKEFMIGFFKSLLEQGKISPATFEKLKVLDPKKLYQVYLKIERVTTPKKEFIINALKILGWAIIFVLIYYYLSKFFRWRR